MPFLGKLIAGSAGIAALVFLTIGVYNLAQAHPPNRAAARPEKVVSIVQAAGDRIEGSVKGVLDPDG